MSGLVWTRQKERHWCCLWRETNPSQRCILLLDVTLQDYGMQKDHLHFIHSFQFFSWGLSLTPSAWQPCWSSGWEKKNLKFAGGRISVNYFVLLWHSSGFAGCKHFQHSHRFLRQKSPDIYSKLWHPPACLPWGLICGHYLEKQR